MDSFIASAVTISSLLMGLDICAYNVYRANQNTNIPTGALYGSVISVSNVTLPFPIVFKCDVNGALTAGVTTGEVFYITAVTIASGTIRSSKYDVSVIWYG